MATEADIHAVVNRWRTNVKNKFRGIASFAERAELRFNAIKQHIYRKRGPADRWTIRQARHQAWGRYAWLDKRWRPIRVGETWGGEDVTAFFRQRLVVPREFDGEKIGLHIFLGGDSLLKVNGEPYHGMDIFRSEVLLARRARAGQVFNLEVESYMNFGGSSAKINDIVASDLVAIDDEIRAAYWDLWCVAKMLLIPEMDVGQREFLEHNLWEALKEVPLQEPDPAAFRRAVLRAQARVRETVYRTGGFRAEGLMYLIGHSHLDLVFMWPYKEFIRKIGRTHATMLRLQEQYPEFVFSQSQAKIYADLKRYYPALFRQIRRRVAQGRWEPFGAFWVEPDCNLISGESFVRQILHGQRFFRENFGFASRICWHPDVFGLSWSIPQILARSGIRYFVTNKMTPWNDTNPWTLNTFWWEGLDASRVLAVVPAGHFMGTVDPDVIDKQWKAFADKSEIGQTLHVYGWGDGGGGVDPEMIESGLRYRNFPGLPRMRFSTTEDAVDRIGARAAGARIPILRDEIYLEAHRGTYTHKGRLKKLNRRAELLYREAELLAALAWADGAPYPEADLDRGWKALLESQFHDSMPGTHVPQAYAEILRDHENIAAIGETVRARAVARFLGPRPAAADGLSLFNSMLFPRADLASVPPAVLRGRALADAEGLALPQQTVRDLDGTPRVLFRPPRVPAVGFRHLRLVPRGGPRSADRPALSVSRRAIENEHLRARFNDAGELVSLRDKDARREVLVRGEPANVFQMFEDTPGRYDAWDIVETYKDHPVPVRGPVRLTVDEKGPLRVSLRLERKIGSSRLIQRISLCAGSRQLRFETLVDWKERQRLLKVAFPVNIHAHHATYDIAFGNMARPNHDNTSFDRAKFEVPLHQWMDLSQHDYGAGLLNDCKYGGDTRYRTMRLTLLKGSVHPDPRADMEQHTFTYALCPHRGDWRQGNVIEEALCLNHPVLAVPVRRSRVRVPDNRSLLSCDAGNLTLEAVKRSEDGKNLVLRLVDRYNASGDAGLALARPVRRAWSCDLTERRERKLDRTASGVRVPYRPYEILTIRMDAGSL